MKVVSIELVSHTCGECGCVFGLAAGHLAKLRETGSTFWCPNGHRRVFRDGPVQELERQLARERAWHDQTRASRDSAQRDYEHERRRSAAARGQVTKIKKRVGNGVCPCCGRTFQNLQRHMAAKHPQWHEDERDA